MSVALLLAVSDNQASIVEALIDHVDAKAVNQRSLPLARSLLHVAARNDNPTIARMLLERGADVNAVTEDHLTALHIAVGNRSRAMVELLLEFAADVNPERKFQGRTPLYMAVEYGCADVVDMLLDKGARIDEAAVKGCNALHLALVMGDERMALALTRRADEAIVNARSQLNGKTPLHLAIENGQYELVRQLIKKGARVDEACSSGGIDENDNNNDNDVSRTPLSVAVRRGDEKIVALLLRYGAKKNLPSPNDNHRSLAACLHQAIRLRCKKIAELLLAQGAASLDSRVDGKTALQLAVDCGHRDMIKVCLSHESASASLEDIDAVALLHDAVRTNDVELAELLLRRGAPVNNNKVRVLDLAVQARFVGMTRLLLKHGALINEKSSGEDKTFALKYAVLALAEGHKVQRENRRLIRADPELSAFYERSREELRRAKSDEIAAGVTVFQMLTAAGDDSLAAYARKDELVRAFPACGYREKYPVYADTLALNYARGRVRNALLMRAAEDFEREFGVPLDSARLVFRLMSNEELRSLVRTFCGCEDKRRHECLPEIFVQF